ncbi:MAG: hypothetical protein QOF04_2874 [Solirubrobacteraceae bacterium]|jgi:hypothetical protein|nr:hypothetical protein [Solirubrobacteraceae bacterium]
MEVPGRDVTADALGPDDTEPAGDVAHDDDKGVTDKLRETAEKVKDAVTPDDDKGAPRP